MATVGESDNFPKKTNTCSLDAQDHEKSGQQKQRTVTNRIIHKDPFCKYICCDEHAHEQENQPNGTKKSKRLPAEPCIEVKRKYVYKCCEVMG